MRLKVLLVILGLSLILLLSKLFLPVSAKGSIRQLYYRASDFALSFFVDNRLMRMSNGDIVCPRSDRVSFAKKISGDKINALFDASGVDYPPDEIVLAVYKSERIIELWAKSKTSTTFKYLKNYNFCTFSGALGPKRAEGDYQIVE